MGKDLVIVSLTFLAIALLAGCVQPIGKAAGGACAPGPHEVQPNLDWTMNRAMLCDGNPLSSYQRNTSLDDEKFMKKVKEMREGLQGQAKEKCAGICAGHNCNTVKDAGINEELVCLDGFVTMKFYLVCSCKDVQGGATVVDGPTLVTTGVTKTQSSELVGYLDCTDAGKKKAKKLLEENYTPRDGVYSPEDQEEALGIACAELTVCTTTSGKPGHCELTVSDWSTGCDCVENQPKYDGAVALPPIEGGGPITGEPENREDPQIGGEPFEGRPGVATPGEEPQLETPGEDFPPEPEEFSEITAVE